MPSLFWVFNIVVIVVFARLLLLLVRRAASAVQHLRSREQAAPVPAAKEGHLYRRIEKWAVLLALFLGVAFFYWGYEEAWERRRIRIAGSSRVKSDLGAIRSTEVSYFAEWGVWVGNQPLTPLADRRRSREFIDWNPDTRFSILGFAPEGKVVCSYALEGPDWPSAAEGFTARAECDIDGDGNISVYRITNTDTEIRPRGGPY